MDEITIDHQRSNFGNINFTLAWNVSTNKRDCDVGQVLSYPSCDVNNVDVNLTNITKMEVTLPSDKRHISGELADFNISSTNNDCPNLLFTVRVNGEHSMPKTPIIHCAIYVQWIKFVLPQ